MKKENETTWGKLVSGDRLKSAATKRKKATITETDLRANAEDREKNGWSIVKTSRGGKKSKKSPSGKKCRYEKKKSHDELFENRVWTLLYQLGFQKLNEDRYFVISTGSNTGESQQIDVLAVDDETALVIECKSTESRQQSNFKKPLEAFIGQMNKIRSEIIKRFGSSKKIKFIWATNNYELSTPDKGRIEGTNGELVYWNENIISYYESLAKHLGVSARYQMLGDLFNNVKIPNLKTEIPAIQAKMGDKTYYSFSLEPEKLLKLGFILHRNRPKSLDENSDDSGRYQRLIKGSRLKKIKEFVNNGGFFPNSIIVAVNSKRSIRFFPTSGQTGSSKIGILSLPQEYQSLFIIDGQHRLYGYSESKYAGSDTIPVIAFDNLTPEEQVDIFMQINENQKAVPKTLRVTLQSELMWNSDKLEDIRKALSSRISQDLGEKVDSPLYDRVIIAEEEKSKTRCITVDAINNGIKKGGFLDTFDKNNVQTGEGTFDNQDKEKTYQRLYLYLRDVLGEFREMAGPQWSKGGAGILTTTRGMQGLIHTIGDIVIMIKAQQKINPKFDPLEKVVEETMKYLRPLAKYLNGLTEESEKSLRSSLGSGGELKYFRTFEKQIHNEFPNFTPDGYEEYWLKNELGNVCRYREQSQEILSRVKDTIKASFTECYGNDWFSSGLPNKVIKDLLNRLVDSGEYQNKDSEAKSWDFINFEDCRLIITSDSNWSDFFKFKLSYPPMVKKNDKKEEKVKWLSFLHGLDKKSLKDNFNLTTQEEQEVNEIYEWITASDIIE